MESLSEWMPSIVAAAAWLGLLWRFETRISALSDRFSRIEGLLEGYFMQARSEKEKQ
jgi:hypothetical protein